MLSNISGDKGQRKDGWIVSKRTHKKCVSMEMTVGRGQEKRNTCCGDPIYRYRVG